MWDLLYPLRITENTCYQNPILKGSRQHCNHFASSNLEKKILITFITRLKFNIAPEKVLSKREK